LKAFDDMHNLDRNIAMPAGCYQGGVDERMVSLVVKVELILPVMGLGTVAANKPIVGATVVA
jgi:hypothetical protein